MTEQGKVFNDPVHGHVELHPLLVKIINTPQFLRLRNIKQLGGAYFVYPGAAHNRFEHSIGVAHLAGQLVEALRQRQPELNITDEDVLCVKIAGLCHDLGHGPFSHMYDGMFIPKSRLGTNWKHEEGSVKMFDYLVENNNLGEELVENDLIFIKELINGPLEPADPNNQWPYRGRTVNKSFLYEIVANKQTGVDVDKFDYFARDCHHLGIKNTFDHQRFIMFARVIEDDDGRKHICCRDKEIHNLYDMFYTRYSLHRRAYKHKTIITIQAMISDAFLKADESSGGPLKLSTAINNMEAYTQLTDRVFEDILHSNDEELQEAKTILNRIVSRDLYHFLGKRNVDVTYRGGVEEIRKNLAGNTKLKPEDFEVLIITMDYGMKDKDPLTNMHFYNKSKPDEIDDTCKEDLSMIMPRKFLEQYIMVYCKKSKKTDKKSLSEAETCFDKWKKTDLPAPQE